MPERSDEPDDERPLDDRHTRRPQPVDDVMRHDPEAPALGAVDGAEELAELPEPQEPG
jgi:hypothetical protein